MKKIMFFLYLFTQLDACAQLVGSPYIPPANSNSPLVSLDPEPSTNGTALVSSYTCNNFAIPFDNADLVYGIMKVGTPVSGVTQSITAQVDRGGTYNISTTTANGVTFSGSGIFTQTGSVTINLIASGTPTAKGNYTFTINTTPNCDCVKFTSETGVYASVNGTLTDFATHNLGANTDLDPTEYVVGVNGTGNDGTLGALYQWGRTNDGHELRNSETLPGRLAAPVANKFITVSSGNWLNTNNNTLWSNTKGPNDPCPPGFIVPSRTQWVNTYRVGSLGGNPYSGANTQPDENTWTWTGNGYFVGPLLFLPAAGSRIGSSGVLNANDSGRYWSSTTRTGSPGNEVYANVLNFNSAGHVNLTVGTGLGFADKSTGCSVRCISQ